MRRASTAARRRYGRDVGLLVRMVTTMLLLGALYAAFAWALVWVGVPWWLVLGLIPVIVFLQLVFADTLALGALHARLTRPQDYPELHAAVERLCGLQDLRKPKIGVRETALANAFTTGPDRRSQTVWVTTGLMERLERRELEAVLAHELSHVASRDALVMTYAASLALAARRMMRMGTPGSGAPAFGLFLLLLPLTAAVYAIGLVLVRTLSRSREYAADRGAAFMTGAPAQLAAALTKIGGGLDRIPMRDLRAAEGVNALLIVPVPGDGLASWPLLTTHPPVRQRIARLMAMQASLDAAPAAHPEVAVGRRMS